MWGQRSGQAVAASRPQCLREKAQKGGLSKGVRMKKEYEETGVELAVSKRVKKQGESWPSGI